MTKAKLWPSHIPAGRGGLGTGQLSQLISHLIRHQPCGAAPATPALQVQWVRNWSKVGCKGKIWTRQIEPRVRALNHGAAHFLGCYRDGSVTGEPCTFALGLGVHFYHGPAWP